MKRSLSPVAMMFVGMFLLLMGALPCVVPQARADEAAYRMVLPFAGSTNVAWTVGRYEKPTLEKIEIVGALPTGSVTTVSVAWGDAGGGSRTIATITNDASGNALWTGASPYWFLASGDVVTFGYGTTTQGNIRAHCVNRATKPLN